MSTHTPGPWLSGLWGGQCNVPAHVEARHHPGPPACVYEDIFYPTEECDGYVSFVGIASNDPGVDVVWTEYDELKIRPADARLIAAAPELLAALKDVRTRLAERNFEAGYSVNDEYTALADAAIAKAEGPA